MENANLENIMEKLCWNQSENIQKEGRDQASTFKELTMFFQPVSGKSTWDNCALILKEKTDAELEPYLGPLLEWLQDMNWPGAFIILECLLRFDKEILKTKLESVIYGADKGQEINWLDNLYCYLIKESELNLILSEDCKELLLKNQEKLENVE